jgi:dihydrofolate reductase
VAKVLLDMAMSLDGFISGPNDEDHGLHNYFFAPAGPTKEVIEQGFRTTRALIMGRRSYEVGAAHDGFEDNPYQVPTFILTHRLPEKVAKGAETFVFVTDGVESALEQAKVAAGDKYVVVGGGANIAQQYLNAGLLDEIQLHLISTLLGQGIRLFEHFGTESIELESTGVIEGSGVTHLRFRVIK